MLHRILRAVLLAAFLLIPTFALAQSADQPNDPLFPEQWALQQIDAPCAWRYTTGSPDVVVAVVDSGVDASHPDLAPRLRNGYDFVDDDNDPRDENGHGTNVAGIIAATLENAQGGTGLAPGVAILPVRVMNAEGYGSDHAIAQGIRYAAESGARVINLSLGATLSIGINMASSQVSEAISYAQDRGALVVIAAGNDFVPLPNAIIGNNHDVLVVAATTDHDYIAPFSNYGESVNIAAPGVHILSTMPQYEVYLTSDKLPPDERFRQEYDYMSGTSQATPFVSALAALLFSAHPDWDARQVAQAIKANAVAITQQNRELADRGLFNAGRIDACAALSNSHVPPAAPRTLAEDYAPAPPALALLLANPILPLTLASLVGAVLVAGMVIGVRQAARRPYPKARPSQFAPPPQRPESQPTSAMPAPPPVWGRLVAIGGVAETRSYPLAGPALLIGRAPECGVMLVGDGTVSRRHAAVRHDGRQITVEDIGSTHGTFLNNQRITAPTPVRRGDVLCVGQTLLRFD